MLSFFQSSGHSKSELKVGDLGSECLGVAAVDVLAAAVSSEVLGVVVLPSAWCSVLSFFLSSEEAFLSIIHVSHRTHDLIRCASHGLKVVSPQFFTAYMFEESFPFLAGFSAPQIRLLPDDSWSNGLELVIDDLQRPNVDAFRPQNSISGRCLTAVFRSHVIISVTAEGVTSGNTATRTASSML
jgi:hypothetical protein